MKLTRLNMPLMSALAGVGLVVSLALPAQAMPAVQTSTSTTAPSKIVASTSGVSTSTSALESMAPSSASLAAASQEVGCVSGTFRAGPGRSRSYGGYTIHGGSYECQLPNGTWVGFYCSTPRIPARWPDKRILSTTVNTVHNKPADPLDEVLALRGASLMPGGANRLNTDMQEAMRHIVTYFGGETTLAAGFVAGANATVKSYYNTWMAEAKARAGARVIAVSGPTPGWNVGTTSNINAKVYFTAPATDVLINNVGIGATVTGAAVKVSASTTTGTTGAVIGVKPTKWGSFNTALTTSKIFPSNNVYRYWSYSGYQQYVGIAPNVALSKSVPGSTGPTPLNFAGDCIGCDGYTNVVNPSQICNTSTSPLNIGLNDNSVQRPEVYIIAASTCLPAKSIKWKVLHKHTWQVITWLSANVADKRAVTAVNVVDCPPWPELKQEFKITCTNGTFSLTGWAIPDRMGRMMLNGQQTLIAAGGTNSVSTAVDCSKANTFKFSIGSQRANGTWNMSPEHTLSTAATPLAG